MIVVALDVDPMRFYCLGSEGKEWWLRSGDISPRSAMPKVFPTIDEARVVLDDLLFRKLPVFGSLIMLLDAETGERLEAAAVTT